VSFRPHLLLPLLTIVVGVTARAETPADEPIVSEHDKVLMERYHLTKIFKATPWPHPAAGESKSGGPEILFTFDDGPHEEYTPKILDALKKHHVHAVFFWTGRRVKDTRPIDDLRRQIVARAIAEGHLVGNHTVHHAHLCLETKKNAEAEIDENAAIFEGITHMPVTWMRVPYGDRCKRLDQELADRHLWHLHWDLDPMEWKTISTEATEGYLISRLRVLKSRAVIIVHDTHPMGAQAIPKVLDWIDKENERRREHGEQEIKILSYADIERERLPPGVDALVDDAVKATVSFAPEIVDDLIAPIAPRPRRTAGL
jgi:peptidoglycan/xylan/chitin deacetylase (PgdA/CDA1 family)